MYLIVLGVVCIHIKCTLEIQRRGERVLMMMPRRGDFFCGWRVVGFWIHFGKQLYITKIIIKLCTIIKGIQYARL